jgi:adenylate cyclase
MGVAFIGLRRFDEAVSIARKAIRQNPLHAFSHRCLASALAHLGREAEAKEAVGGLLELDPDFRISERVTRSGASRLHLYVDGLRKAGLPE